MRWDADKGKGFHRKEGDTPKRTMREREGKKVTKGGGRGGRMNGMEMYSSSAWPPSAHTCLRLFHTRHVLTTRRNV